MTATTFGNCIPGHTTRAPQSCNRNSGKVAFELPTDGIQFYVFCQIGKTSSAWTSRWPSAPCPHPTPTGRRGGGSSRGISLDSDRLSECQIAREHVRVPCTSCSPAARLGQPCFAYRNLFVDYLSSMSVAAAMLDHTLTVHGERRTMGSARNPGFASRMRKTRPRPAARTNGLLTDTRSQPTDTLRLHSVIRAATQSSAALLKRRTALEFS